MKPIPLNAEIETVARRIVWFESPAGADFLEALEKAPPGIVDRRSWAYWNSKMGRYPAPPLPTRQLP